MGCGGSIAAKYASPQSAGAMPLEELPSCKPPSVKEEAQANATWADRVEAAPVPRPFPTGLGVDVAVDLEASPVSEKGFVSSSQQPAKSPKPPSPVVKPAPCSVVSVGGGGSYRKKNPGSGPPVRSYATEPLHRSTVGAESAAAAAEAEPEKEAGGSPAGDAGVNEGVIRVGPAPESTAALTTVTVAPPRQSRTPRDAAAMPPLGTGLPALCKDAEEAGKKSAGLRPEDCPQSAVARMVSEYWKQEEEERRRGSGTPSTTDGTSPTPSLAGS